MDHFLEAEVANIASRIDILEDRLRESAKRAEKANAATDDKVRDADYAKLQAQITTIRMEMGEVQKAVITIGKVTRRLVRDVEELSLGAD